MPGYHHPPLDVTLDDARGQLDRVLLRLVDAGMGACLLVVPFVMGGRQALGQLVLVSLAVITSGAWLMRQVLHRQGVWRRSSGEWVLLGGIAVLLAQLAPLPPSIRSAVAPHVDQLLPAWTEGPQAATRLGRWESCSLTPAETRHGLALFLAYAMLFTVAMQRIRAVEDVERLLQVCAWAAVLMAIFGLLQYLAGNGKFFWFYEHPYSTTADAVKGSFTSRNHFAHFLALGVGPLVWWIQHSVRTGRRRRGEFAAPGGLRFGVGLRTLALCLVLFAGLLSLSRGGILVLVLGAATSGLVSFRASSLGLRSLLGLGAVAALIGAGLMVFGYQRVAERVDDFTSGSIEALDQSAGRRTIWKAVAAAIPHFAALGSGVGSHSQVYPMYVETRNSPIVYTHAENSPLQLALETGLAGLALAASGVLLCAGWCLGGLRRAESKRVQAALGAVAASLAVSLVHSLFDFVWYVPAGAALAALLAACACRLRQISDGERGTGQVRMPRLVAAGATVAVVLVGAWMIEGRVGPVVAEGNWFQYLRLARTAPEQPAPGTYNAPPSNAASATPDPRQADRETEGHERRMIAALEETLRWQPDHIEANLRLTERYLALFDRLQQRAENVMPFSAIADAALAAQFGSRQALEDWLSRAVGDHYRMLYTALDHARRGLGVCPLAGEGYLYLGELCFLEGARPESRAAYLEQALRVRPFHGRVLFDAGRQALLAGDAARWLELWRRAFRTGRHYQQQIVTGLAGRVLPGNPAEEIRFLLETFQPDRHGLYLLTVAYASLASEEQLASLRRPYAQALAAAAAEGRDSAAAELWVEAMALYRQLKDGPRALECGRQALRSDPNHFWVRFHFATCLMDQGQFAEAEQHLRWCRQRKPNDDRVERTLQQALLKRLAGEDHVGLVDRRFEGVP